MEHSEKLSTSTMIPNTERLTKYTTERLTKYTTERLTKRNEQCQKINK